jgi:hypothetical protein
MEPPTNSDGGVEAPEDGRYVTIDVEVSGDLEARWVYDCVRHTTGLLLRHIT